MAQVRALLDGTPQADLLLITSSRTLVTDDELVGVVGLWPMWPGVGRCWSVLPAHSLKRFPKSIHGHARNLLERVIARDDLCRVEAVVVEGHAAGKRWVERLGFEHEGLMRNYGMHGVNCHLYARCR